MPPAKPGNSSLVVLNQLEGLAEVVDRLLVVFHFMVEKPAECISRPPLGIDVSGGGESDQGQSQVTHVLIENTAVAVGLSCNTDGVVREQSEGSRVA